MYIFLWERLFNLVNQEWIVATVIADNYEHALKLLLERGVVPDETHSILYDSFGIGAASTKVILSKW